MLCSERPNVSVETAVALTASVAPEGPHLSEKATISVAFLKILPPIWFLSLLTSEVESLVSAFSNIKGEVSRFLKHEVILQ